MELNVIEIDFGKFWECITEHFQINMLLGIPKHVFAWQLWLPVAMDKWNVDKLRR